MADSTSLPHHTTPAVEAVLFDYGMVLSGPPAPEAWSIMRDVVGVQEERFHEAYWHFRHDYDRGALTGRAYWEAVAARVHVALGESQIKTLLAADVETWTTLNPPMVEWAARLQSAGIRTGILSNIGDCIGDGIIKKLPWLKRFAHCTWSHALFMAKPEKEIFLRTAEALDTPPAGILFIDDRAENVEAARAVGMQAIQYTDQHAFELEMHHRGFGPLLEAGVA